MAKVKTTLEKVQDLLKKGKLVEAQALLAQLNTPEPAKKKTGRPKKIIQPVDPIEDDEIDDDGEIIELDSKPTIASAPKGLQPNEALGLASSKGNRAVAG